MVVMSQLLSLILTFGVLLQNVVFAQTFSDFSLPPSWPGISHLCEEALNTTVACPGFLGIVSVDNPRLDEARLSTLCVDSCRNSLNSARQTILDGCTASTDVITYDDVTYPATFVIDHFLYTYDLACRRDPTTNEFCDVLLLQWLNQDSLTSAQNCSDCMLGAAQTQLNSPFGYDEKFAEDFASTTSSCGASNYPFTVPASYGVSGIATTTTGTPTASAVSCAQTYTVSSGDTCNSIALAHNVSTYAVIGPNGINPKCDNLQPGVQLCLPAACSLYLVQPDDTCAGILQSSGAGITDVQFLAWNPNINALCGNIYELKSTYVCISPPGGSLGNVQATTTLAVSTAASAVPKPTNALEESNSNCAKWYTIQEGDFCDKVSITYGIALKDFYFLNPEVNTQCTNLLLGISYCVQAVGSIATYTGYSTSQFYTLTSNTFSTTTYSTATAPQYTYSSRSQLPTASGTIPNCETYRNYEEISPVVDQSQGYQTSGFTDFINRCIYITGTYGVSMNDLLNWNPSLSSKNCTLAAGYSYCVSQSGISDVTPAWSSCLSINSSQVLDGTTSSCNCFTLLNGYDNGDYQCVDITGDFNISTSDLQSWNAWIGSDCDTGLYAGLGDNNHRPVCVRTGSGNPTTPATTSTLPSTTTSLSTDIGPTQTGIVSECTTYYTVQSGDTCSSIEGKYSITFQQLYAWNPSIGSNCENLWLGYAYCVSAPLTATSSSSAASPTQSHGPLRDGTPDTCSKYYTVQSGDSCAAIESTNGIDFTTLYRWNINIGSNCENLWVGYAVCVAGGP